MEEVGERLASRKRRKTKKVGKTRRRPFFFSLSRLHNSFSLSLSPRLLSLSPKFPCSTPSLHALLARRGEQLVVPRVLPPPPLSLDRQIDVHRRRHHHSTHFFTKPPLSLLLPPAIRNAGNRPRHSIHGGRLAPRRGAEAGGGAARRRGDRTSTIVGHVDAASIVSWLP